MHYYAESELLFQYKYDDINAEYLNYGFDKISNIYNFNIDACKSFQNNIGDIGLFQNYRGDAVETESVNFRDQELFSFYFQSKDMGKFKILFTDNWQLTSDNIKSNTNTFQRANSNIGLQYKFFKNSKISALSGFEYNQQNTFKSTGIVYGINTEVDEKITDIYNISSNFSFESIQLRDKRNNSDLNLKTQITGAFSNNDLLSFDFEYDYLNKDFISYYSDNATSLIENRSESNVAGNLFMKFKLPENFYVSSKLLLANSAVNRAFMQKYEPISYSSVERMNNTLLIDLNLDIIYSVKKMKAVLNTKFFNRNENYRLNKLFEIDENEFENLKKQETSLDNSAFSASIGTYGFWLFGRKDSLAWNGLISIYRYDTPEKINNDDKDELNEVLMLNYFRRINRHISISLLGEIRYKHLVFLKSQRSSQNYTNRIIRFSPFVKIKYNRFEYNPSTEVLANYTIYDYESTLSSARSYSFRQISYRDSILYRLTPTIHLQGINFIRYFVNGILLWKEFSEIPQIGNFEFENKLLLTKVLNDISIGAGIRIYGFQRNDLQNKINGKLYEHFSIGPQVQINMLFLKGSILNLSGWYEKQTVNSASRYIPNIKLICKTRL
ncbi:MAG: hypothetical protein WCR42_04270 [bacterium]